MSFLYAYVLLLVLNIFMLFDVLLYSLELFILVSF